MNKSFRCSYEISKFSNNFLDKNIQIESFERYEEEPKIIEANDTHDLEEKIVTCISNYKNLNYTSVAVLCKNINECEKVYKRLKNKIDIKIINGSNESISGVMIMTVL